MATAAPIQSNPSSCSLMHPFASVKWCGKHTVDQLSQFERNFLLISCASAAASIALLSFGSLTVGCSLLLLGAVALAAEETLKYRDLQHTRTVNHLQQLTPTQPLRVAQPSAPAPTEPSNAIIAQLRLQLIQAQQAAQTEIQAHDAQITLLTQQAPAQQAEIARLQALATATAQRAQADLQARDADIARLTQQAPAQQAELTRLRTAAAEAATNVRRLEADLGAQTEAVARERLTAQLREEDAQRIAAEKHTAEGTLAERVAEIEGLRGELDQLRAAQARPQPAASPAAASSSDAAASRGADLSGDRTSVLGTVRRRQDAAQVAVLEGRIAHLEAQLVAKSADIRAEALCWITERETAIAQRATQLAAAQPAANKKKKRKEKAADPAALEQQVATLNRQAIASLRILAKCETERDTAQAEARSLQHEKLAHITRAEAALQALSEILVQRSTLIGELINALDPKQAGSTFVVNESPEAAHRRRLEVFITLLAREFQLYKTAFLANS